jgi:hypothetical protein
VNEAVRSQREADLSVLITLFSRSEILESASKLYRIRNSLTSRGYLAVEQFDNAVATLLQLQMAVIDGSDEDRMIRITGHGKSWLMTNFHWVQGDRAFLEANSPAWVMTSPNHSI